MNEPSSSAACAVLQIRAEDARRARVILMLAHGESYSTIEATVPYRDYILGCQQCSDAISLQR
jgi:hypothetical protein